MACLLIIYLTVIGLVKVFRVYSWRFMYEEYGPIDVGLLVAYFGALVVGANRCWICNNTPTCADLGYNVRGIAAGAVALLGVRVFLNWRLLQQERRLGDAARHLEQKAGSWRIDAGVLVVAVLGAILSW